MGKSIGGLKLDNKRVILINGDNNKLYEQAIFIMKNNTKANISINFVDEAEKIINNYSSVGGINLQSKLRNVGHNEEFELISKANKKSRDFETTLNAVMLMFCIILLCGLILIIR